VEDILYAKGAYAHETDTTACGSRRRGGSHGGLLVGSGILATAASAASTFIGPLNTETVSTGTVMQ